MHGYYKGSPTHPHLSAGAVIINERREALVHYYTSLSWGGHVLEKFYTLMRETMRQGETPEQAVNRGLMDEFGATAAISDFLGSCAVSVPGELSQKTTIYFLCNLESIDLSRRSTEEIETQSEVQWKPIDFLIEVMQEQSKRLSREDLDESSILRHFKKLHLL